MKNKKIVKYAKQGGNYAGRKKAKDDRNWT